MGLSLIPPTVSETLTLLFTSLPPTMAYALASRAAVAPVTTGCVSEGRRRGVRAASRPARAGRERDYSVSSSHGPSLTLSFLPSHSRRAAPAKARTVSRRLAY